MADYISREKDKYIKLSQALEVLDSCSCWWVHDRMECIPAANVRENDVLEELINKAVLTLNDIYIGCRIKKDDYVRLLNDIRAMRGAKMDGDV